MWRVVLMASIPLRSVDGGALMALDDNVDWSWGDAPWLVAELNTSRLALRELDLRAWKPLNIVASWTRCNSRPGDDYVNGTILLLGCSLYNSQLLLLGCPCNRRGEIKQIQMDQRLLVWQAV